ncbi:MAG: helix-turn-helix transcriptional regulator, partial [Oscillospiraceae bacterium]
NLIIKSVKDADYKNTMLVVDKFFSQVYEKENVDIKSLKNIVSEMMVMVMRSIFKSSQTSINIFGRDVQPYAELQNMETILQIETFVKDFFNKLFEDPNLYLEYTYHPEIQQAINIIMKNYMKPLTVEAVANELLISQYYLMHLFKKEVGKTFNEFLTRRRIDVSIELLMTNKYKIHEICDMIGYKNTNYFAKIFKQLVGVSPKNYVKQSTYCKEN